MAACNCGSYIGYTQICRDIRGYGGETIMKHIAILMAILALLFTLNANISFADDGSDSTSAALFDAVTTAAINSFMDGLSWSAGYLKSIDGSKQGAVVMASRTIYNAKLSKCTIPVSADLFGTVGHDNMLGGGFSADLTQFVKLKAGVGYAAGGYGWSWSVCPISKSF